MIGYGALGLHRSTSRAVHKKSTSDFSSLKTYNDSRYIDNLNNTCPLYHLDHQCLREENLGVHNNYII
jgi:hypothetical protein